MGHQADRSATTRWAKARLLCLLDSASYIDLIPFFYVRLQYGMFSRMLLHGFVKHSNFPSGRCFATRIGLHWKKLMQNLESEQIRPTMAVLVLLMGLLYVLKVSLQMKFLILKIISVGRDFVLSMFKPSVIERSNSFCVWQVTNMAHYVQAICDWKKQFLLCLTGHKRGTHE